MRSFFIFILLFIRLKAFCLIPANTVANPVVSDKVDSLKSLLKNKDTQPDTLTANRINKLAAEYFELSPDSALFYGKKGISLSHRINYKAGVAYGLLQTGHANYFKGDFTRGKANFDEAASIYQSLNDKKGLGYCYTLYGRMYTMQADNKLALKYLNMAIAIYQQQTDNRAIADIYNNIGMAYFGEGQHSMALDYYYKALFICIKEHYQYATADIYNNIGDVSQNIQEYAKALDYYNKALTVARNGNDLLQIGTAEENLGEVQLALKHYQAAINYLSKSIDIAIKQDDKDGISYISADLGLCYANKNQMNVALSYFTTALETANRYKNNYDKAHALVGFATVYNLQKNHSHAYQYALDGERLAVKLDNLWFRANAVFELHKALAGLGKYENAYKMSMLYIELKDSLNNSESIQKITSQNLEYNFNAELHKLVQQHQEKDQLYQQKIKQQSVDFIYLSIILSGVIIIAMIYYNGRRKQQNINAVLEDKNQEVLQQKTDLDEQANKLNDLNHLKDRLISVLAHDLRAPLSTLRGLFYLLEDVSITHEQFLDMIPHALKKLEYTSDFLDTLLFWINSQMENFEGSVKNFPIKEVITCEILNYREQALEKGIRLINDVDEDLIVAADLDSIRIVIRNLVTNAIKFSRKNDTICLCAHQHGDNYIIVSIKDSGVGMPEKQLNKLFKSKVDSGRGTNNESGTGMGLLFCKDLIEKCNGKIWVQSEPGSGTEFFFTLPLGSAKEEYELVS